MTEALYYLDPRLADFEARVVAVDEGGGVFRVELDRTAFYPEGGGQPADRGTIGGIAVTDVQKQGDRILHTLAQRIAGLAQRPAGETLAGRVDWPRRWDYMQQHTGQHLLSNALLAACKAQTVSVHLGEQVSTIELDAGTLSDADLERAEERAAELIAADLPVTARWVDEQELAHLALRRPTARKGRLRLVEIGGVDRVACGGLHVARTAEVQLVRLSKVERIRGRMRTHWKIGRRALLDYRACGRVVAGVGEELSAPPEAALEAVLRLRARCESQEHALETAARRVAREVAGALAARAEPAGSLLIATAAFTGEDGDFLRRVGQELAAAGNIAFCLINEIEGRLRWALGAGPGVPLDFGALLPALLEPIAGKGGGKPPLWQGAASRPEGRDAFFAAFARACRGVSRA